MRAFPELTPSAPAGSLAEAEQLAAHFNQIMQALLDVVDEETRLVRAGRLSDAIGLAQSKANLARLYLADAAKLKHHAAVMRQSLPQVLASLRQRHNSFRAQLQINLTVLATAHAVAEGLVRGVSDEIARKSAPKTYGASGRTTPPPPTAARPLAISRRL